MRRFALAVLLCSATFASGAPVHYGIGHPPGTSEVRTLDISVAPDGAGLPAGRGTARDGAALYHSLCAACHGVHGEGAGDFPALAGGIGSLRTATPVLTVGSYWPYATTLWDYIRRAMPYPTPGVLTSDQVYALTAHVLELNGVVSADTILTETTLPRVQMPNRDGFVTDPRPDVPAKGRHSP
jgi:S-disulfanyl-L-cysteine oxidoreductase SoxD